MRRQRTPAWAVIILSLLPIIIFLTQGKNPKQTTTIGCYLKTADYNSVLVAKAIDGDTLRLANGERVRLIGIDTPESSPNHKLYSDARRTGKDADVIVRMGKAAAEFTRQLVEGQRIRLEFDVQKRDKYGRLLAYAYLPDGVFINAEIIRQGYANLMTVPPNVRCADLFLRLYQEARANKKGLWKDVRV